MCLKADSMLKKDTPCLLFCEGRDEKEFLEQYINRFLINEDAIYKKILVINFGGNNELINRLKATKLLEGFNYVKGIAVIRDAETNASGAQQSIIGSLSNCGISGDLISSNPYYLFPYKDINGIWQNGTLEDLCIDIVADNVYNEVSACKLLPCCNTFLETIKNLRGGEFPRKHKNLLHTYFSATNKFVDLKIGEAARAGAFNWQHQKLNDLKAFLLTLANMGREV